MNVPFFAYWQYLLLVRTSEGQSEGDVM